MKKLIKDSRNLRSRKFFETDLIFTRKELIETLGSRTAVEQHVQHARIYSLGSGYYASTKIPFLEALILVVSKYFPQAVISGASALFLHGLVEAEHVIEAEADINRTTNLRNKIVRFRRVSPGRRVGVVEVKFHGRKIRVYDPERSLAECLLQKWPREKFKPIVHKYLQHQTVKIERIKEYDEALGLSLCDEVQRERMKQEYSSQSHVDAADALTPSLIAAAYKLYCEKGTHGLSVNDVALEAGVSPAAVSKRFAGRKEIEKALFDAFAAKVSQTGYSDIFNAELSPLEFIQKNVDSFVAMSDNDQNGYRFQRWAIAEENPMTIPIFEDLCSALVQVMKEKIIEGVPEISPYEAEVRAIFLGAMMDQYTNMRWFFTDHLKSNLTKHDIYRTFRMMIRDVMVPFLLDKPNPLFQKEELTRSSFTPVQKKYRRKSSK